jgi:hypothetical protein
MKAFILQTQIYVPKNKFQELVQSELKILDHTLCENFKEANNLLSEAYDSAVRKYKGKARINEFIKMKTNENITLFWVVDTIYMSVYNVVNNLTNEK